MKLLDTDVCLAYLNGRDRALQRRLLANAQELILCSVVKAELWFGSEGRARVQENQQKLEAFFSDLDSLPFDDAAARTYGHLRAQLRRLGTPIGPNDLLIAATAMAHDATLVTRNQREFERVPGLTLETW